MNRLTTKIRTKWANERQRILVSLAIALLIWGLYLAAFGPLLRARAEPSNTWLTANPIVGQKDVVPSGELPESVAFAGNIPCSTTIFTVKPTIPPLQQAEVARACAVSTPLGVTAPGGFTDVFKSDARVYNAGGGPVNLYPIPGNQGAIVLENTAQGWRLHYYSSGILSSRKEFNSLTREMRVYLSDSFDWTLKDKSGKLLYVRPESISFSSNGEWMVADVAFLASIRVNLKTGEVVPFNSPYAYHVGLSVTPHTAISDDGRTVVTTSDRGDFTVTDVSSCASGTDVIRGPVACNSASHEESLRSQIPGYYRIYQPRFVHDNLMSFYASYNTSPSTRALAKFRFAPSEEALKNQDYLALGDSFASGEGAYNYFPETDTSENMCHLSRQSYPYLIGQQLQLSSYSSVACSGAKIQDINTYAQRQNIPSSNTLGRLLPGFKKQIQYVQDQNPTVVTVGIGGNDIGFIARMKACLGVGNCYQTYEDRLEIVREVNKQFPKLVGLYNQLKSETKQESKIYVVGYPHVAKAQGSCGINVPLGNEEIIFSNQLIDYLNQIIALSADKAGVRYVDVSNAFDGHKLCERDGVSVAFNGVMLGDDAPFSFGPFGSESFHPNKLGHQLYKQKIIEQTSNLTQAMVAPNSALQLPGEDSGLEILKVPKSNRGVRETTHDELLTKDLLIKGLPYSVKVGAEHFLQVRTDYKVELQSDPANLGTFTTDITGEGRADIVIPPQVAPGFHTLHIFGQNITNSSVDIYKTIYVAETADDMDGDGLKNSADRMIFISQTSQKDNRIKSRIDTKHGDNTNQGSLSSSGTQLGIARAQNSRQRITLRTIMMSLLSIGALSAVMYAYNRFRKER